MKKRDQAPVGRLSAAQERLGKPGRPRKQRAEQAAHAVAPDARRLLDVAGVAFYLSVSPRIVHALRAAGHLRPVRLELAGAREIRKLLFDRVDLDALVAASKEVT